MMRLRASLAPSPLTPSGTGKESFKVTASEIADVVAVKFYPTDSRTLNETFIEITMDRRTAWHLANAIAQGRLVR